MKLSIALVLVLALAANAQNYYGSRVLSSVRPQQGQAPMLTPQQMQQLQQLQQQYQQSVQYQQQPPQPTPETTGIPQQTEQIQQEQTQTTQEQIQSYQQQPQQQMPQQQLPQKQIPQQQLPQQQLPQQQQIPQQQMPQQVVPQQQIPQQQRPVAPQLPRQPQYAQNVPALPRAEQMSGPCVGRQPEDRLVDPTNKKQYIVCLEEGRWTIMPCAPNTVFNQASLRCESSLKTPVGCASNPCMNNGRCTDLPLFVFRCECQPGFAGDLCEKMDGCVSSSCGAEGVCIPLAAGAPLSKYCVCQDGNTFGTECNQLTEQNPCLTNDADLKTFPTRSNPAIYVQCEGHIPHLRFCPHPLQYNHDLQQCDWSATTATVVVPQQQQPQQQQYSSYAAMPQQVVPQQVVPQQVIPQQVAPQQIIPQQQQLAPKLPQQTQQRYSTGY